MSILYPTGTKRLKVFTAFSHYNTMIKLGFHMSIAGSVANAPRAAAEMGYGDFQLFTSSSRAWANTKVPEKDRQEFIELNKKYSLTPFAHIPYLCNIASTNPQVYEKSKTMLVDNIRNCMSLKINYLVIHLGSHLGKGTKYGIENVCAALSDALEKTSKVEILLENTSGYKNSVGSTLEEIGSITDRLNSDRIGVCFDTCHAFAAGYDLGTKSGIDKTEGEFESCIGAKKLKLIHLNDAKFPLGSRLDRHWHIGKGHIGREGFINLFKNKLFGHGFFVLETPVDLEADSDQDMAETKSIIKEATGIDL
jgi:deoxyribonuclease IV